MSVFTFTTILATSITLAIIVIVTGIVDDEDN